jgi:hypothetical protein
MRSGHKLFAITGCLFLILAFAGLLKCSDHSDDETRFPIYYMITSLWRLICAIQLAYIDLTQPEAETRK